MHLITFMQNNKWRHQYDLCSMCSICHATMNFCVHVPFLVSIITVSCIFVWNLIAPWIHSSNLVQIQSLQISQMKLQLFQHVSIYTHFLYNSRVHEQTTYLCCWRILKVFKYVLCSKTTYKFLSQCQIEFYRVI